MSTLRIEITKDGELKQVFENQQSYIKAFAYMLRAQSNSISHAIKYEGWKVKLIDEKTGHTEYYKH